MRFAENSNPELVWPLARLPLNVTVICPFMRRALVQVEVMVEPSNRNSQMPPPDIAQLHCPPKSPNCEASAEVR